MLKKNKIMANPFIEIQDMPDAQPHEIEKAYKEAYRLARRFHELYEGYALQFGYITRNETREFDPSSKNGRLMAYVSHRVVQEAVDEEREKIKDDLLAVADTGEHEDLRREVIRYFE